MKWTRLWLNLGLHGKVPMSNRLHHGTACNIWHSFPFCCHYILHTLCLRLKLILSRLRNECSIFHRRQESQEIQRIFTHITAKYCLFYLFLLLKDFRLLRGKFQSWEAGNDPDKCRFVFNPCLTAHPRLLKMKTLNSMRPIFDGLAHPFYLYLSISSCSLQMWYSLAYFFIVYSCRGPGWHSG